MHTESMNIQLRRAMEPGEMVETPCALCDLAFEVESIVADVLVSGADSGAACPVCVQFYGQRNPERFPSLEEYEAAKARAPEPIWPSVEAVIRAEDEGTHSAAYKAAWLTRSPALPRHPPSPRSGRWSTATA